MPFRASPLKPSLVEWKLGSPIEMPFRASPLKPSLVEWKHHHALKSIQGGKVLETFLSGMETGQVARHLLVTRTP